jgi:predicted nucleic acid-binding protein
MNDKILIDTSILINAYFCINKKNQEKAIQIIDKYSNTDHGYVTNQNIIEFINICKNKFKIKKKDLNDFVNEIKSMFKVVDIKENTIQDALNLSFDKKIPFLDTLLAQTSTDNNIYVIYSENLNLKKIKNIKFKGV